MSCTSLCEFLFFHISETDESIIQHRTPVHSRVASMDERYLKRIKMVNFGRHLFIRHKKVQKTLLQFFSRPRSVFFLKLIFALYRNSLIQPLFSQELVTGKILQPSSLQKPSLSKLISLEDTAKLPGPPQIRMVHGTEPNTVPQLTITQSITRPASVTTD